MERGAASTAGQRALDRLTAWTSGLALVGLLGQEGYELVSSPALAAAIVAVAWVAVVTSVVRLAGVAFRARWGRPVWARLALQGVLLIPVVLLWQRPSAWALWVFLRQAAVLLEMTAHSARYQRYADSLQRRPANILVLSFALIIAAGSVPLTFPRATTDGQGASVVDAVFTATSATCVTGLATLNTVEDRFEDHSRGTFTPFGQFVILLLIQVGGLGIMTLSAATVVLAGRRLTLKSHALMQSLMDETSAAALKRAFRDILGMTLVIEAVGAVILFFRFREVTHDTLQAAWQGAFHSVSAFCNAGFSLYGDSLASFRGDATVNLTHAGLIVLGGLGFTVITALARAARRQPGGGGWKKLPLQVRMVTTVTLGLIVAGTILYFFLEYDHSLKGLPLGQKLLASFFQSVTLRTAGFNTVDMSSLSRAMLLVAALFMFVGASPSSTGGGIKTTTLGVLFMSVRASLLGRPTVEVGRRTIPQEVVTRAIAIVSIASAVLVAGLTLLVVTEPTIPLDRLLFEAVSALGTVGLSMNVTPELSTAGRVIIIALMFIGRVGPLTIALAVGQRDQSRAFRYPEARLVVG